MRGRVSGGGSTVGHFGVDDRFVRETTIRPARADDLEPIVALADDRRRQYASFQPVFWRPAPDAAARQRPYLNSLIADVTVITLVAISDETLVVVCGHLDQAKRAALESCRLTIASEWWVAPLSEG